MSNASDGFIERGPESLSNFFEIEFEFCRELFERAIRCRSSQPRQR